MAKFLSFWKAFIWLAIIGLISLLPSDNLPDKTFLNIPYFDKIVHFMMYFLLCLLLINPFRKILKRTFLASSTIAFSISLIFEILQNLLTTSRDGNVYDLLANFLGILTALLAYSIFQNTLVGKYL